jgi:hypothetical protein
MPAPPTAHGARHVPQRSLAALLAAALSTGCAHMWARNYTDLLGGQPIESFKMLEPEYGEPTLIESSDIEADVRMLEEQGYYMIGSSAFVGGSGTTLGAKAHARRLDASIALVSKQILSSSLTTIYLPGSPTTVTSSHSGSIYGSGGLSTYSGTTSTTVPGTPTAIPWVVTTYQYTSVYFVKGQHLLGAHLTDLLQADRAAIGRNIGVRIRLVVKNSPAYLADLFPGDIIVAVGGETVRDAEQAYKELWRHAGTSTQLTVLRGTKQLKVKVELPVPQPVDRAKPEDDGW